MPLQQFLIKGHQNSPAKWKENKPLSRKNRFFSQTFNLNWCALTSPREQIQKKIWCLCKANETRGIFYTEILGPLDTKNNFQGYHVRKLIHLYTLRCSHDNLWGGRCEQWRNNGGTMGDNGSVLLPDHRGRRIGFFEKGLRGATWPGCNRSPGVPTVRVS